MNIKKSFTMSIDFNSFYAHATLSMIYMFIAFSIISFEFSSFWARFIQNFVMIGFSWNAGTHLLDAWDVRPWKKIIDKSEQ